MTPRSAAERPLLRLLGERGGTLTAGEAAARTGAPLELVERQLLSLAVAAGADLRVGNDGSVAYRFPRHIRRLLLARSLRLRLQASLGWLGRLLERLVRVSVGGVLVLLALLLISVLMLMGVIPASDAFIRSVLGLLLHAVQGAKQGVAGLIRGRPGAGQPVAFELDPAIREDLELLEQVFSVLFGDGDPNRDLEQRRWRRIGCFLAHRGGAVIADDLAPLLDLPTRPSDGERAMEIADAAMLPVLLRFDGRPEVSEQGELAYQFPSLQVHSELAKAPAGHSWAEALEVATPPLRERRLVFSRAGSDVRWAYAVLCVLVLLLAPLLFGLFTPTPPLVAGLAWFAIGYALLLIVIPLLRLLTLRDRNRGIAARNSRRTSWALSARVNTVGLARKRAFGRSFARRHSLTSDDLAYTTEEGLLEQQIET